MSAHRLRAWTVVMPVAALAVSAGIAGWEHARHERITSRLAYVEKEYSRLDSLRPKSERVGVTESESLHHDHHDQD
jgi:hypothetical protein